MITGLEYKMRIVDVKLVPAPLDVYCCKCDHRIRTGTTVHRVDAATFFHAVCPNLTMTHPAPHKVLYA